MLPNINSASIVRYPRIVAKLGKGLHQNVEQDHDYGLEKIELKCNKITVYSYKLEETVQVEG
jgi:hypothetical protein